MTKHREDMDSQHSRRQVLGMIGGVGLSAGLSACHVVTHSSSTGSSSSSLPKISFPASGAKLPTDKVALGWMDSGDLKALYEKPLFTAYHKAHPNITVNYDGTSWVRINETIPLAVRNGTAPDVFAVPNNVPVQVAVGEGWVAPIDNLIPNFAAWKGRFPDNAFIPGVHIFNGRTYSWPAASNKRCAFLLMYDTDLLKKADHDPVADRFTWDTFRATCKKITAQGKGQQYGLMAAGTGLGALCAALAELAGASGLTTGGINWKTGQYNYTAPEMVAAVEFLLSIKSDGSIFPGYLSLGDADSRARMTQRVAGMIFDGPWDIPAWPKADPSYKFGVAMPPTGKDKAWHPLSYQETGANTLFVSSKAKHPEVAGDILSYMGTPQGQTNMVVYSQGNLVSEMPEANAKARQSDLLDTHAKAAASIADKLLRKVPMVQVRNPDAAKVILAQKPVKPSLADVAQGIFSGQLRDATAALKSLNDRWEKSLDNAIKIATKKGAKISRDDWKFPNWDPTKDYDAVDYTKLGR